MFTQIMFFFLFFIFLLLFQTFSPTTLNTWPICCILILLKRLHKTLAPPTKGKEKEMIDGISKGCFDFLIKKKNEKRKKKKTGRSNFLNIQRVIVFWFFMFYLFTFFFWLQNFDANFIFVTPTHKNLICSERQKVR